MSVPSVFTPGYKISSTICGRLQYYWQYSDRETKNVGGYVVHKFAPNYKVCTALVSGQFMPWAVLLCGHDIFPFFSKRRSAFLSYDMNCIQSRGIFKLYYSGDPLHTIRDWKALNVKWKHHVRCKYVTKQTSFFYCSLLFRQDFS